MKFSKKLKTALGLSIVSILVANFLLSLGDETSLIIYGASYWSSVGMRFILILCLCALAEIFTSSSFEDFITVDFPIGAGISLLSPLFIEISIDYEWEINLLLLSIPFVAMSILACFIGPSKKEKEKK